MSAPLVEISSISRSYAMRSGMFGRSAAVHAVDGVSLRIPKGETLGLVGESGSGKSTTGRIVLGLEPPDRGEVRFDGKLMAAPGTPGWRAQRARMDRAAKTAIFLRPFVRWRSSRLTARSLLSLEKSWETNFLAWS